MKRGILIILALVFLLPLVFAESTYTCNLDALLLNQDPYPAIPGEQVKLVFQVDGLGSPNCGDVSISISEAFPFKVAPEPNPIFQLKSGTYVKNFGSFVLVPYKVNINADALEGESSLDLLMASSSGNVIQKFNIEIADLRTDFEVSIKNYDKITKMLTFEILNIGEHDVEALTIDVPKQETLLIKGSPRNIIGSLDSNDDTTFNFEATPTNGDMKLILTYTDEINERRVLEKTVYFDMDYFNGKTENGQGMSIWFYITIILLVIFIIYWYMDGVARKKRRERQH